MSKPCNCGSSKSLTGCKPCYREYQRLRSRDKYWRLVAPFKTRQRGRPRKDEIRITGTNSTAIKMLSAPLRANN